MVRVRRVPRNGAGEVRAAAALFDHPLDARAIRRFLADPRHHLLIAWAGATATGFVSAVELLHPDKPLPELFVYELGVAPAWRRRRVGTQLLRALRALARRRGCGEMFVLSDPANRAARGLYTSRGAGDVASRLHHWDWRRHMARRRA